MARALERDGLTHPFSFYEKLPSER